MSKILSLSYFTLSSSANHLTTILSQSDQNLTLLLASLQFHILRILLQSYLNLTFLSAQRISLFCPYQSYLNPTSSLHSILVHFTRINLISILFSSLYSILAHFTHIYLISILISSLYSILEGIPGGCK